MSIETNCKNCGDIINVEKGIFNCSTHKIFFCSNDCNENWNNFINNGKRVQCRNLKTVYCVTCGKKMLYEQYRANISSHFYCSVECKSKWIKENQSGKNHVQWSRVLVKCEYCGMEKYVPLFKLKTNKLFFCSLKHKGLWMSENYLGENSPVYVDSKLRNEREVFNMSLESRSVRDNLYRRDKNICQFCGKRVRNPCMHHIEPFSINKKRRGDIDNVVTLCHDCHKRSHMRNTIENYIFSGYTGSQLKKRIHNDNSPKSFNDCMGRLKMYLNKSMACPECGKHISHESGCITCVSCGWSACST